MNHKRLLFSFLLLFSVIMTACSPKTQVVNGPGFVEIESNLVKQLDVEKIYATVEELTKEPRVAGTESEQQAASFLTEQLEDYGYDVERQVFDFERYIMPETTGLTVDGFDGIFSPAAFQYSVSGNVTGTLIDAGYGLTSDYKNIDATGKIALVAVKNTSFFELVLSASDAGAKAIILYFPDELEINNWTLGRERYEDFIPALALTYSEGKKLLDFVTTASPVNATVTIEGSQIEKVKSQNLIVTKQPKSKKEKSDDIVIIGAHYDSVDKAPGASDNASGTAVVLEIARMFKDVTINKELRILFFGAEEEGLYGSEKYVSAMTKDEIKRSVAMFNLDMVGSADAGELSVQTVDGMDNASTILANKAYEELNGDSILTDFGDRSDHVPFHEAGIDAALFSYFPLEDWYHSANDTIDKLSKDRLLHVAKIVAKSALELTVNDSNNK